MTGLVTRLACRGRSVCATVALASLLLGGCDRHSLASRAAVSDAGRDTPFFPPPKADASDLPVIADALQEVGREVVKGDVATDGARDGAGVPEARDGTIRDVAAADGPTGWWSQDYSAGPYAGPTVWTKLSPTITVDGAERVFVTDGNTVYVVEAGVASVYCNQEQVLAAIGSADGGTAQITLLSLAAVADGTLYMLAQGPGPDLIHPTFYILASTGRNTVTVFRTVGSQWQLGSNSTPSLISAVSPQELLMVRAGLYAFRQGTEAMVYGSQAASWGSSALAASKDGFFFYISNSIAEQRLVGGLDDGSGIGVILSLSDLNEYYMWSLDAVAAHPAGSAVLKVGEALYYVTENGAYGRFFSSKLLYDIFHGGAVAVGPSGAIYVALGDHVVVVRPAYVQPAADGSVTDSSPDGSGSGWWSLNYRVSRYVEQPPWGTNLRRTVAVDSHNRAFVTDGTSIFAAEGGAISVYGVLGDMQAALGGIDAGSGNATIHQLSIDDQDRMYAMVQTPPYPGQYHILVSDYLGPWSDYFTFGPEQKLTSPPLIRAVTKDKVFAVMDGLYSVGPGGQTRIYPASSAHWADAWSASLAVDRDGFFYYVSGANSDSLVGGLIDGSGAGVIMKADALNELYYWNFEAVAIHPAGGVAVKMGGTIYHFDRSGNYHRVLSSPSLYDTLGGDEIAVGPNNTIYLVSSSNKTLSTLVPSQ
jgi:hypothetical protein